MSDEKKSVIREPETRDVTVTVTARLTRKQADALVSGVQQLCTQLASVLGAPIFVDASAPASTAKSEPDPSRPDCQCIRCQLMKALGIDVAKASAARAPESENAPDSERDPAVNVIPARGPWGAS
jgi:hypothetical protein